ncbi:hypothetical protein [Microcoleus sp. N3A4]
MARDPPEPGRLLSIVGTSQRRPLLCYPEPNYILCNSAGAGSMHAATG